MKVFAHITFEGFYPVGTAAVVVANDAAQAAQLLSDELKSIRLGQEIKADEFIEIDTDTPSALVLRDGDY